jgi:hypothetical protein
MPLQRRSAKVVAPESLETLVAHFVECRETAKRFSDEAEKTKKVLMKIVEKNGQLGEEGHIVLDLPHPVAGFTALQRQKRKTRFLDAEAAMEWLKKKKLYDEVVEIIEVEEIPEDKLYALVFEKRAKREDIDALYTENVTYAFVPVK